MALAFVRYSVPYITEEAQARRERMGVHTLRCVAPWDRRAQQHAVN